MNNTAQTVNAIKYILDLCVRYNSEKLEIDFSFSGKENVIDVTMYAREDRPEFSREIKLDSVFAKDVADVAKALSKKLIELNEKAEQ